MCEAVICVVLLIVVPAVRVFIPLGNVECGLHELESAMPVLVNALVLVARPPDKMVLQR